MRNQDKTMEKIVALCKGRGYVYAGSEIYGGLSNTWDYGPLGVEYKNNVKKAFKKYFEIFLIFFKISIDKSQKSYYNRSSQRITNVSAFDVMDDIRPGSSVG